MLNDPMSPTQPMVSLCLNTAHQNWMTGNIIESVLAQTHWNWELFIIDDGEDTMVQQQLDYYTRRYPDRITVIPACVDELASDSTPSFLQLAKGEYYLFLAPDDVMPPQRIANQLAFLQDNPGAGVTRNIAVPTKVEIDAVEFSDSEAIISVKELDSVLNGINLRSDQSVLVNANEFAQQPVETEPGCTEGGNRKTATG